jgi:hypothetical protein
MESLTVLDFAGKNIRFERRGDRMWVSLTDMAKATGKQVNDYTRSKSATEFLTEFESITGNPVMLSNVGGAVETTGTWAVEEIAIARICAAYFYSKKSFPVFESFSNLVFISKHLLANITLFSPKSSIFKLFDKKTTVLNFSTLISWETFQSTYNTAENKRLLPL